MSNTVMPEFRYHAPEALGEVLALLDEYGDAAKVIAGGTDLIPKLKAGVLVPGHVVSLKNVRDLHYLDYDCEKGLSFGATTTLRELERHPVVKSSYRALHIGCQKIASTQIKNVATAVGNICNAVPSADTAPALLVLGAEIVIRSARGERVVPVEEFFTGVCKTVVAHNELVTGVRVPAMEKNAGSTYIKYAVRRAMDLAMVGVAVKLVAENNLCKDVKIALGAVATTPIRARAAEELLIGRELTDDAIARAAACASGNCCRPITDLRATREYRQEIVRVLARDAIKQSMAA